MKRTLARSSRSPSGSSPRLARPIPRSPSRSSCRSRRAARPTCRPRHRPEAAGLARPAVRDRQPGRRDGRDRRDRGQERGTGRLHVPRRIDRRVRDQPVHPRRKLQYDPVKDLDPITVAVAARRTCSSRIRTYPRHNSVPELVALLKKTPGKITFRVVGRGLVRPPHRGAVLAEDRHRRHPTCRTRAGRRRSPTSSPATPTCRSRTSTRLISHIKAGKLKVLAVTGDKRSPLLPNVPTLAEAGVTGADVFSWQAIAGPKGMPADVKQKLHAAIVAALNDPRTASGWKTSASRSSPTRPSRWRSSRRRSRALEAG